MLNIRTVLVSALIAVAQCAAGAFVITPALASDHGGGGGGNDGGGDSDSDGERNVGIDRGNKEKMTAPKGFGSGRRLFGAPTTTRQISTEEALALIGRFGPPPTPPVTPAQVKSWFENGLKNIGPGFKSNWGNYPADQRNAVYREIANRMNAEQTATNNQPPQNNNQNNPGGNQNTNPGGNQNANPGGNQNANPGGNQNTNPGGNQNTNPGGNQNANPGGNRNNNPGGNQNTNPGGNRNTNPGGNQNTNPGGNQNTNPGGNQNTNPGGNQNTNPGGNQNTPPGGNQNQPPGNQNQPGPQNQNQNPEPEYKGPDFAPEITPEDIANVNQNTEEEEQARDEQCSGAACRAAKKELEQAIEEGKRLREKFERDKPREIATITLDQMGTGAGVVGGYLGFTVCGPGCGAYVGTALSAPFKGLKVMLQASFAADEAKRGGANQNEALKEFGKTAAIEGAVEVVKETIGHVTPGFANINPMDMMLDTVKEVTIDEAIDALRETAPAGPQTPGAQSAPVDFSMFGGVGSLVDVHVGRTGMPADQTEPAQ